MRLIDRVYFSIARIGGTQTMLSVVENLGRGLGAFNRIRHRVHKHERFQLMSGAKMCPNNLRK